HLAYRNGKRYVARLAGPLRFGNDGRIQLRSDASYLITGGLGGLGLTVGRWMVDRGARHLVLAGRKGASAFAKATVRELEAAGAQILVARMDVSRYDDVAAVFEQLEAKMPPLKGVIHAAGVVLDGTLIHQDEVRFKEVMDPKIKGAWNLHLLTREMFLD